MLNSLLAQDILKPHFGNSLESVLHFFELFKLTYLSPLCLYCNIRKVYEYHFKQSLPDMMVDQLGHMILCKKITGFCD